jgi:DNA-binding IclR family transcriptional regulator
MVDTAFDNKDRATTSAEAARGMNLPSATCDLVLGNLVQLGACEQDHAAGNGKLCYQLKQDVIELMTQGGLAQWQQ